ncbi:Putative cytochrome C-type biogenesis protein [Salmonella enterica subsp. enterica serovar Typhimurium]|nr:Putative cytochrome C-type biogenesis protein [Salmonella enterica subsp. enterica serovar Typhimurium]
MKLNKTYINIRDKWWGLPLILPSILLPVLSSANTYALTSTGNVVLFYLPLAFMLSLMLFFGWAGRALCLLSSGADTRRQGCMKPFP